MTEGGYILNIDPTNLSPAELTPDIASPAYKKWTAAVDAAEEAAKAYFDNVAQRKATLEKQAVECRGQLQKWQGQRKTLAAKVIDLSSRGLIDKAAEVDSRMSKLDKAISATERKLRLIDAAEPKGDPKLYQAVKAAMEAMEAEGQQYRTFSHAVYEIAKAERSRLSEIMECIPGCAYVADRANDNFRRVDRHFRELDRIEREARERYKAEQAAKQNKREPQVFIPG